MHRMLSVAGDDDPVEREMVGQIDDREGALLGALLHDIGKTGEGGHVPIGARIAVETLERIGVEPATRELASFMVREHLLLPDTATRRDLTDENLILDVAATVGTTERLAALYPQRHAINIVDARPGLRIEITLPYEQAVQP